MGWMIGIIIGSGVALLFVAWKGTKERKRAEDLLEQKKEIKKANNKPLPKVKTGSKWDLSNKEMNKDQYGAWYQTVGLLEVWLEC